MQLIPANYGLEAWQKMFDVCSVRHRYKTHTHTHTDVHRDIQTEKKANGLVVLCFNCGLRLIWPKGIQEPT